MKIINVEIIFHEEHESEFVFTLENGGKEYLLESDIQKIIEKTGV